MSNEPQQLSLARRYWSDVFSIDSRSLAILRVGIATIVLWNLFTCFSSISTFYSESGVLPLGLSQEVISQSGDRFWSMLWLSDSMNWLWVCFGVTAIAAVCLLLGYNTLVATAVCLVMVWSFQVRNPLVLTGGDVLLRMVLFWGLFLPWSEVWSLDQWRSDRQRSDRWRVTSVATAAIMLQLTYIYFFSGIAKWNGQWSDSAVVQSLNLEMYVNEFGSWIAEHTQVLYLTAPVVLIVEIFGPLLLFTPLIYQYWRGMMMALMWAMHLMIWLTMSIGIFSMTAMLTWVVFVPSGLWNGFLGRPSGFRDNPSSRSPRIQWVTQSVCAVFAVYVLLMNISNIGDGGKPWFPSSMRSLANVTMTQQEFKMFANPPTASPWPQYVSTLANQEVVDVFASNGDGYSGKKPESVYRYMRSQYWRRYHFNLINQSTQEFEPPAYRHLRERLLEYHAEKWNRRQPAERQVTESSLYMNFDELGEDGLPTGTSTREVWAQIHP